MVLGGEKLANWVSILDITVILKFFLDEIGLFHLIRVPPMHDNFVLVIRPSVVLP